MAGPSICQHGVGSVSWAVAAADIERAGKSIFEFRRRSANDKEAKHRHPMLYRDVKWDALPAAEKVYYCDMAILAFITLGVDCIDAPKFEETAYTS